MKRTSICLVVGLLFAMGSYAHEIRPALLQIRETEAGLFDIQWKLPRRDNMVISLVPRFPSWFELQLASDAIESGDGALMRYLGKSSQDIHMMPIRFEGIENSLVDVLVYIELINGEQFSLLAQPTSPVVRVPEKKTLLHTASTYLLLGIEHILKGWDHLLFVLALLLIVTGKRKLIWTITAFTLAHSLTLSLSVLGFIGLPAPPVEATIALSIVFLAWELIRLENGQSVVSARKPWLVSFSFGLLHGMGFASALSELGLPQTQVPAALAFFNLGVEIGQLLFIFSIFLAGRLVLRVLPETGWRKRLLAYAIGSIAVFWTIERIAAFWTEHS